MFHRRLLVGHLFVPDPMLSVYATQVVDSHHPIRGETVELSYSLLDGQGGLFDQYFLRDQLSKIILVSTIGSDMPCMRCNMAHVATLFPDECSLKLVYRGSYVLGHFFVLHQRPVSISPNH